jgi:serine/threonine protein kinase
MSLRIEAHAEPIPGYRLIERIGSGGFGEVWKAEAPGGLFKAIKFVQREASFDDACAIGGSDSDHSRADQEWKSLIRVKTVRHPFILLLERFENIENYLVIVMELADRTLSDRFKECRSQGLPGIPREELLNYLAEASEVLDLMNSQYQLQHLDIKPQNLFLVHNHIKVADFGLVKDMTTGVKLMTITGGVTPVYAAPETFDMKFSRQSDQYSLAIVYQEMLTGHRPFAGTSMKQLILQHLQNAYDLTPAPVHDRPVIARALSKNPEHRFPTCIDFVQRLRQATVKIGAADDAAPPPAPAPMSHKQFPSVSNKTLGARGNAGPVKPVDPNFSIEHAYLGEQLAAAAPRETPVQAPRPKQKRPSTHELPGIVQPALVVGIGQLGIETLTQLRHLLATELAPADWNHVRLLAIDTDPETIQHATQGNPRASLRTQETLLARLQRPSQYLKTRNGKLPTDSWLHSKLLHRIPREQNNAGLRALGRLAFVDNYRGIAKRLEAEMLALCSQDTPHDSDSFCDLGLRSTCPRIYIVTSLTGNTGGGMFLDVAYLLRKLLADQGHDEAEIVGLFYLPTPRRNAGIGAALGNSYAALTELQYFCHPDAVFAAHYETAASLTKGEQVTATGPAFQRCVLLPLPELKGKLTGADNSPILARAGEFLYRDLATVLGQAIDEQRGGITHAPANEPRSTGVLLQSVGMYRMFWPRRAMLEECSRHLCSQLVARWMNKDAKAMADTITQWTHERWEAIGMRPEGLIERFQQLAEESLKQKPETLLAEILALMQKLIGASSAESPKAKPTVNLTPVVQAMDCLERVLGLPEESRSAKQGHVESAMVERTLEEIARVIADECEQKLAELAVTLLEDPNYRLAGAEEALRQFCTTVEQSLKSQETLAKELNEKSAQLYQRINQLIDTPAPPATHQAGGAWGASLGRRAIAGPALAAADVFELVRTYTKTRYHGLVLTHLNRLYLALRGHLSDQIREVGFCRARLGELQGLLQPAAKGKKDTAANERTLFPPGCVDLSEAVEQVSQSVTVEDLLGFDDRVQAWIKIHCRALLEICMGSATMVKNLAPAMLVEAEGFLNERLQGASVADMYLTAKRGEYDENAEEMIFDDLQRCLEEAIPEIGRISENNEISIVSFPNDEPGKELQQLLKKRLPAVRMLLSDRQDEMIFYHEIVQIQWKDLAQLGPIALEAYQQRCGADPSSLHSRADLFEPLAVPQAQG